MKMRLFLLLSVLFAAHITYSVYASCMPEIGGEYLLSEPTPYSSERGYGYDVVPAPSAESNQPFFYSVKVPDGNYKVTLLIGSYEKAGITTVRAESRRQYVSQLATRKGEFVELSFVVHKRSPVIYGNESVAIKERERNTFTWDDKLTLEFNGDAPVCERIRIEPADSSVVTVFLCGNSTVVDQSQEPWASWGQMIPAFFNERVCIANYAESGESANTFISGGRLKKALSMMKEGDYLFIEFGHNDQKQSGPGKGAWYSFMTSLKVFVDEVRAKGAHPVLLTPTQRRRFDASGTNQNTHGEFPDAMRWLAQKEGVALIDLNEMTRLLFNALGEEGSKRALVHYPAGTFPGQTVALADNTHFSVYGANQVAKCVITGIQQVLPGLAAFLSSEIAYNPGQPNDPDSFVWHLSPFFDREKPDGD
jgi:lysophospholipase L1-like esterase